MKRNFGFTPHEDGGKYGFISYKCEDEARVAPYAKALRDKGVNLWYDYGIPAGEDWFQAISKHIVRSSFMILFVTQRVFQSSVIQTEIQTAEMWDIPVVPVFLESIDRSKIPIETASFLAKLSLKQGVDGVWNMSSKKAVNSIYELIVPMIASDTGDKIQQRGRLLERQASLTPDVNASPMVQNALSEVQAENTASSALPPEDTAMQVKQANPPDPSPQKQLEPVSDKHATVSSDRQTAVVNHPTPSGSGKRIVISFAIIGLLGVAAAFALTYLITSSSDSDGDLTLSNGSGISVQEFINSQDGISSFNNDIADSLLRQLTASGSKSAASSDNTGSTTATSSTTSSVTTTSTCIPIPPTYIPTKVFE